MNTIEFTDLPNVNEGFDAYVATPSLPEGNAVAALVRYDALEVWLRRHCLQHLQSALVTESSLTAVSEFWRNCLKAVHRLVQFLEEHPSESNTEQDTDMSEANVAAKSHLVELATMNNTVRKLPILLMEDILDTLDPSLAFSFWSAEVASPLNRDVLFGDLLWTNTRDPNKKPCWLVFLKASNKFLRRLQAEEMFVEASNVSSLLSKVYPLSEKSTMRSFGSHNTDHLVVLETEQDFDQQETTDHPTSASYSFYENFWKLQHDFRNPNSIVVVDFIRRLTTVMRSFQSHSTITAKPSRNGTISKSSVILRPYLTHSRILPIQLSDPAIRTLVLTQFWIIAEYLMSKVPALRGQLDPHVRTAETLIPADYLKLLKESNLFLRSESQWKEWKQNKCLPDLDDGGKPFAKPIAAKRKIPDATTTTESKTEQVSLMHVSKKMRHAAPLSIDHLEEFVDAIDPEAGIEPEYHPKNNAIYSWRALRLLAREHLDDFSMIQTNGDFENMIRHVYETKYNTTIPGEPIPDVVPFDDVSEVAANNDVVDAGNEDSPEFVGDAAMKNDGDAEMKDGKDGDAVNNDDTSVSKTNLTSESKTDLMESDAMLVDSKTDISIANEAVKMQSKGDLETEPSGEKVPESHVNGETNKETKDKMDVNTISEIATFEATTNESLTVEANEQGAPHDETKVIVSGLTGPDTIERLEDKDADPHKIDTASAQDCGELQKIDAESTQDRGDPPKIDAESAQGHGDPHKIEAESDQGRGNPQKIDSESDQDRGDPQKTDAESAQDRGDTQKIDGEIAQDRGAPQKIDAESAQDRGDPQKIDAAIAHDLGNPQKFDTENAQDREDPQKMDAESAQDRDKLEEAERFHVKLDIPMSHQDNICQSNGDDGVKAKEGLKETHNSNDDKPWKDRPVGGNTQAFKMGPQNNNRNAHEYDRVRDTNDFDGRRPNPRPLRDDSSDTITRRDDATRRNVHGAFQPPLDRRPNEILPRQDHRPRPSDDRSRDGRLRSDTGLRNDRPWEDRFREDRFRQDNINNNSRGRQIGWQPPDRRNVIDDERRHDGRPDNHGPRGRDDEWPRKDTRGGPSQRGGRNQR